MKGCGKFIKNSDDYGWIDCGDELSENEDNGKVELCKECASKPSEAKG